MFSIGPTPFDVRLVAFQIPIRVHPSFWLMAALLGWFPDHIQLTFIWVVCAFVSILIHELGHALMAETFGWPSEIVLYFNGGVAMSHRYRNNTAWRSIAVSFMGPAAGFLLLAVVMGIEAVFNQYHVWEQEYRIYVFRFLKLMNLFWGLFNLLPVLPLDGGHIFQSLCHVVRFRDADGIAMKVSVVVGGVVAYYFLSGQQFSFIGMLMLMMCIQNVMALQSRR